MSAGWVAVGAVGGEGVSGWRRVPIVPASSAAPMRRGLRANTKPSKLCRMKAIGLSIRSVCSPVGATTSDGITDSQTEAAKQLTPFQFYFGMWQALDLLTADERSEENEPKLNRQTMCVEMPERFKRGGPYVGTRLSDQ